MTKVTNTLQSLIFGGSSVFIMNSTKPKSTDITPKESDIIKLIYTMQKKGYVPSNADMLFNLSSEKELNNFKKDFSALVKNSTKQGVILRTTFFDESYPTDYTSEEWKAIMAQYAVTYGWTKGYSQILDENPAEVLAAYISNFSDKKINLTKDVKPKVFTIKNNNTDLVDVIKNILNSKTVLRTQQLEIIKKCPKEILITAAKTTNIPIKETAVQVMSLLQGQKIDFPILKTAQDILRYIVLQHSEKSLEGQLNKTVLKDCHMHIPTSARKTLLNNLELIANEKALGPKMSSTSKTRLHSPVKGSMFLCEDMFTYEAYWKIINKYLQYEPYAKARIKYPLYTRAIDLLYENDRSWTFNGRYSIAKEKMDYAEAIKIAAERPGFMLRNMLDFMRMVTGTKKPRKIGTTSYKKAQIVKTDALAFFESSEFTTICKNRLNTKLAFQLMEQINSPKNNKSQKERIVQGINIHYDIPIPAIDGKMKKAVLKQITDAIKFRLNNKNNKIKSLFISDDVKKYALQYSGHKSTELSYSGEFMSPNSIIPFSELGSANPIIRLGVMWRSKPEKIQSVDIDHNVTLLRKNGNSTDVYYGTPTFKTANGKIAASSSADITNCGNSTSQFSTEIVDLDVIALKKEGITELYNSFINFGGGASIGSLECYIFMQIIDQSTLAKKKNRNELKINLAKTDYAIQIDANNTDQTGSYIGLHFNLINETVEVLAIPVHNASSGSGYSNIRTNSAKFKEAMQNRIKPYELGDALALAFTEDQLNTTIEEAEFIITRKNAKDINISDKAIILHPGKDGELINEFLFD